MAIADAGLYILRNLAYPTRVLDMSSQDGTLISGYSEHGGPNQQWHIFKECPCEDNVYTIRDGMFGNFIGYNVSSGRPIGTSACKSPVFWRIVQQSDGSAKIVAVNDLTTVLELGSDQTTIFFNQVNSSNTAQSWIFETI